MGHKNYNSVKFYHGTTIDQIDSLLAKQGELMIYCTQDRELAEMYSELQAKERNSSPIVFEVKIDEISGCFEKVVIGEGFTAWSASIVKKAPSYDLENWFYPEAILDWKEYDEYLFEQK